MKNCLTIVAILCNILFVGNIKIINAQERAMKEAMKAIDKELKKQGVSSEDIFDKNAINSKVNEAMSGTSNQYIQQLNGMANDLKKEEEEKNNSEANNNSTSNSGQNITNNNGGTQNNESGVVNNTNNNTNNSNNQASDGKTNEEKQPETVAVKLDDEVYKDQNKDVEKVEVNIENDDLAKKRLAIIEEFKKKLEENRKKEEITQKTKDNIEVDEFAIIIDEDAINEEKEKELNKEDKKVFDLATQPIIEESPETMTEKEYKNKYLMELKNSIIRKKKQQEKNVEKLAKTLNETNDKKSTEIVIKQNINKDKFIKDDKKKDDPEFFNIRDTGVSKELIESEKFDKLFNNKVRILRENLEVENKVFIPIPVEKNINSFKTSDIPGELLSYSRSEENKHIPIILRMEDFQEIAKVAIDENDLSVLRSIVELTKDPDYVLANGQTILNYAAYSGADEILKYLLFSGANINIQDYDGNTPLHNAILREDDKIIKLLVKNNCNLNIFNVDGYTPLMLAIVNGKNDISSYLLKFDQDLLRQNYRKETVLDLTNKFNRTIIKELILEKLKEQD